MDTIVLSTVTSKGQITIPKQIRDRLRLQAGSRVEFHVDRQGRVTMRPRKNVDIRELKGIVRSRRKTPASVDEMNEAIARGWAGQ
jgi:AbrB family looped-hinge helix DNA binding protein